VAGFVGANNRVAGTVKALDGEYADVETPRGWMIRGRRHGALVVGAGVEAFIRPEATALGRTSAELPSGHAVHSGEVISLLFDGANSAILLKEQRSGFEYRIALPQTGAYADLQVGTRVYFSFEPDRAACFAAATPDA
jgi:spermidine/putrescine transport system ATP-binding protein